MKTKTQTVMDSRHKNYDMISLPVPKGERDKIKAYAESKGMSMNEYIRQLIVKDMKQD